MQKLVNGKVISIDNLDLFEAAAEGAAINRTLPNIIPNDRLQLDFELIEKIINTYKTFYKSLPFPLYSIDSNTKYCSAGLIIKRDLKLKNKMWVDNGLYICMDEEKYLCLGFINESWGIVKVQQIQTDNVDVDTFKGQLGFDEFAWVLVSLFKGEKTDNYYNIFMPKFVEACNNQHSIMRWELSNMLQFNPIPVKKELSENKVLDVRSGDEYTLDIYLTGKRRTSDQYLSWSMQSDSTNTEYKTINVYGYELYKKSANKMANKKLGEDKLKQTNLYGINSLFCELCTIKNLHSIDRFPIYKGIIIDNHLVFIIDNRLFATSVNNYSDAKEIARGVEIYSYNNRFIYLIKPKSISMGIRKETVYSYSLEDANMRLCKIQFSRS